MRILQVTNSTNPAGGGPIEAIRQAARAVANFGHTMEIVCADAPDANWLADLPVPTYALGPAHTPYRYSRRLVPWLTRYGRDYHCAIVNGIWLHPSYAAWKVLKPLGVPYFVYAHGLLDPAHRRVFPVRHLKKVVSWIATERRVLDDASAVFFTCEEERRAAKRTFWPQQRNDNGLIVPYCIAAPPGDPEHQSQQFLTQYPHLKDQRRLLFLSRVHPKKGCDILIEAFAQAARRDPSLHLVIAGPGRADYVAKLRNLAASLGISQRTTWTGMLEGDLKWGAFHTADLFALPSHHENFGIAVIEALACGVPVLISRAINIADSINQDGAGIICEDNVMSVTAALERWIATPESQRKAFGTCAAACFRERFGADAACRHLLTTLQGFMTNCRETVAADNPHGGGTVDRINSSQRESTR